MILSDINSLSDETQTFVLKVDIEQISAFQGKDKT